MPRCDLFMDLVISPITRSSNCTLVSSIPPQEIIEGWKIRYGLDISEELEGCEELKLFRCKDTDLYFFTPCFAAGTSHLYEQLQNYDWYYQDSTWEHDMAFKGLQGCRSVLEVGCGKGAFVERLCRTGYIEAEGIELNRQAVEFAQSQSVNVRRLDLRQLADEEPNSFDAVCSFQVLEHVSEPFEFIEALIDLVRPGGTLILSVPNSDSFLRYADNLLDMPPHHMTRWSETTFRSLHDYFPLTINKICREPLARHHVPSYLTSYKRHFCSSDSWKRIFFSSYTLPIFRRILDYGLRRFVVGQSLYVEFSTP